MGACSSKPKTTEFEGPTDPSKKTDDVGADRIIDAVDAQVSQQNEPGKEDKGEADEGARAARETHELIASRDKEPMISTAEGVSYSVKPEFSAVDEAGNSAADKIKADIRDAPKVDAGDGAAGDGGADYKEDSGKATTVDVGVGGDRDKVFEDKAVVLDEARNVLVGEGGAYIDKAVAADEEKAHESSDKGSGNVTVQDEELSNLQVEARGVESPIIGVVQSAEPIHLDDVSESVLGSSTPETAAHVDSKVSEEAANLSPGLPQEAPEEKEEVLPDDSNGSPLLFSTLDDGMGQESRVDVARGEAPLASADAQAETSVENASKPETFEDPLNDLEETIPEPQEERSLEEGARESHAEVTKNEGNAGVLEEPEPEAPKVHEGTKTSIEPKAETTLEKAIEGQGEGIVDEPKVSDVQPQALASEETAEDSKPKATADEAIAEPSAETAKSIAETDREEKVEKPPIEEATTNEFQVGSVDAANFESSPLEQARKASGEGDLSFEDASDVPLKVESSTIEPGEKPNS